MSLIQCDIDCIYQKDGYCELELPSAITNYTGDGCVHCIRVLPRKSEDASSIPEQPQTPLLRF